MNEAASFGERSTTLDLALIGTKQKTLIWLTVPWVPLGIAPVPVAWHQMQSLGFLLVHIASIVVCYQLAQALRKNVVLWTLLAVVPLVNLFAIARLVAKAAQLLKENGINSGFTGVKESARRRL
jgi:hypothetical protein